jgi:dTDP-4-amino-4,6-dideoxygalactose transaminase
MSIPIVRPSIKRADMDSVLTCMVSDSLGPGALGQKLVKDMCEYLGLAGGAALREYGRAVKLSLVSLGLERGARVLISPLAPRVYWDAFADLGIEAVFSDVEGDNGCLGPSAPEPHLAGGLAAIVVHANLGFAPAMDALAEYGVPLIEDISCAVGAHTGTKKLGSFGNYVIVSLEPEGVITAGGGVLLLGKGRKELAALSGFTGELPGDVFLPDFNAALGITQVKNIERFIERRREIASVFSHAVMQSRHKILTQGGEGENVFFSFPVLLDSGMKDVQAYARKKGVETEGAFHNAIITRLPQEDLPFPAARSFFLRCLLFPLYPALTKTGIGQIEKLLSTLP